MIVSEARREANRRNAQRSTGPRTEAGKERSRQNALKHGLSAEVVRHPEDPPAADQPRPSWPDFLLDQVDGIMSRLERCDRLDARHRARISLRAELSWDDDRRLEVEFLGSGIARDPAEVARALKMSPHGCDWMIERWSLLARAADRDGAWTAEQRTLAFDLLGRPVDLRGDDPTEAIDLDGRPTPGDGDLAALARREVASLLARKAQAAPLDALDRAGARADPGTRDDLDLRRLQRHEADLHRRLRWCVAQLAQASTQVASPTPPPAPAPAPTPAPMPPPPEPVPDFDFDFEFDPFRSFDDLMARAEAHLAADDLRQAEASTPARPATARPDPRLAREKARQADRRGKRDR